MPGPLSLPFLMGKKWVKSPTISGKIAGKRGTPDFLEIL